MPVKEYADALLLSHVSHNNGLHAEEAKTQWRLMKPSD